MVTAVVINWAAGASSWQRVAAVDDILFEIDVRGARSIKELFPEAVSIFPVQPWMDIAEMGCAVVAVTNNESGASPDDEGWPQGHREGDEDTSQQLKAKRVVTPSEILQARRINVDVVEITRELRLQLAQRVDALLLQIDQLAIGKGVHDGASEVGCRAPVERMLRAETDDRKDPR